VTAGESSRKGFLKMFQSNEIRDGEEIPGTHATNLMTADALNIEEVVRRARAIHRRHGGFFGYHFEDWALAWSALAEKSGRTIFADKTREPVRASEASEECFGCAE
jgi:hypothetical protein